MDYIERIKQLRVAHGFSQRKLSKELKLSPSAYGLYETGQRQMSIETLIGICKLFQVSSDEVLGLTEREKKWQSAL